MAATPWGYDVELRSMPGIPPLISLGDFHNLTGGAFGQDDLIEATIAGVSARIRSFCGWHIWPDLECRVTLDGSRFLPLPASHVLSVSSVTVLGRELDPCEYEWGRDGLVRLRVPAPDAWSSVEVRYVAGHEGVACPEDLAALVAHRVVHNVAMPFGVQQETVGSVSKSYVTSMAIEAGGVNLSVRDRSALAPYRIWEAT